MSKVTNVLHRTHETIESAYPLAASRGRKKMPLLVVGSLVGILVGLVWAVPALAAPTPATAPSLPTFFHQQTDPRLAHTGTWTTVENSKASGGSFAVTNKSGSTLTIRFVGSQLDWIAKKGPAYGEATVAVDSGTPVTVDLSSAKALWQQDVWSTGVLPTGTHKVTIAWTGAKGADSTSTSINADAFLVTGRLLGLHEQTNADLQYKGAWTTLYTKDASGASLAYAGKSGASVTIRFTGLQLTWIAKTGPALGIADVKVDGVDRGSVDLYSAGAAWKVPVWTTGVLADGAHTVTISWTGTKNAAATGTRIDLDAVDIAGVLN
jgi:hypothetical protein